MTHIVNKAAGRSYIHIAAEAVTNVVFTVVGNSSVSNFCNNPSEIVSGANISRVLWSTDGTGQPIKVYRGNTIIMTLHGTGEFNRFPVSYSPVETISIDLPNSHDTILIELAKTFSNVANSV